VKLALWRVKLALWRVKRSGGGNGEGTTANFLSSLIGSLPAMHELAEQAGIELPAVLGRVRNEIPRSMEKKPNGGRRAAKATT